MHMGFHSSASYGATPYFIKRTKEIKSKNINNNTINNNIPNNSNTKFANIMIDVPRFNSRLAQTIENEGGIDKLIITHRDNFPDHEK